MLIYIIELGYNAYMEKFDEYYKYKDLKRNGDNNEKN